MPLSIDEITDGVFHIQTESQYEIASAFMRVQEFYESPFKEIRGHFFTHEQYMDVYAYGSDRSGSDEITFSYFEDWVGFNIPGNAFNKWVKLFSKYELWEKEENLINLVYDNLKKKTDNFYVIGTYSTASVIDHELSHAWYYLDPAYKRTMLSLLRKLPKRIKKQCAQHLKKEGYTSRVYNDEIIAYLSTNPMTRTAEMFGDKEVPWEKVLEFQLTFKEFKDEKIDEDN
ncbi:hypothetical protein LCGC14_1543320 [marine sediment metagenome]|uniref:Uncharacterized protein n=1 Tax=marine sediment metagenome TaxID=412755 RepID=A0A0F9LT80_9ZZZZ